jgi:hypothetical protein
MQEEDSWWDQITPGKFVTFKGIPKDELPLWCGDGSSPDRSDTQDFKAEKTKVRDKLEFKKRGRVRI